MAEVTQLADLPDEILSNFVFPASQGQPVALSWAAEGDRSTLLNLCLVSRRFKDLAQQVLFRTISLRLRAPTKESHHDKSAGNIHIFDALVSTLTAHPRLRPYVLSLSISVFHHPFYERFHSHSSLLSLTPNLRILCLSPPPVTLALAHADHPHLHSLTFNFNSVYDEEFQSSDSAALNNYQMVLVARHFFLPSLRTFRVDALYFYPKNMGPKFFPTKRHGTSGIESLELMQGGDCEQDIGFVQEMFKCIKSLKQFVFEVHVSWEGSHLRTADLQALTLRQLVKPFEQELTKLCIAASDAADFGRLNRKVLSADGVKEFRAFVNLRIFAVPEFFLVGDRDSSVDLFYELSEEDATESVGRFVDGLPQGVEYLQVQYMHGFQQGEDLHREVRIRRMEELARRKGEEGAAFGKLKKVIWWMQMAECWNGNGQRYGPIEDLVALKKVFEDVGVDFEWISQPYWEYTPFGEGKFDHLTSEPQNSITSLDSLWIR